MHVVHPWVRSVCWLTAQGLSRGGGPHRRVRVKDTNRNSTHAVMTTYTRGRHTIARGAVACSHAAATGMLTAVARQNFGDIMSVPPDHPLYIGGVSIVNPVLVPITARREAGAAAGVRYVQKRNASRAYDPDAIDVVPLWHETHGRLGRLPMTHLNQVPNTTSRRGEVDHGVFLANALRRSSVALCEGHAHVLRIGLQSTAGAAGRAAVRACARPSVMDE